MKFFAKISFVSLFLLVFSASLVILGSLQALFGTLRWYNTSEQKHEELQDYPIYSATEQPQKPSTIRVFIAPKPTSTESNVYVFMQDTASQREKALYNCEPRKGSNNSTKSRWYRPISYYHMNHQRFLKYFRHQFRYA
jgi:hypothetical protein